MFMLALLLLALVPLMAFRYARSRAPRHIWLTTGAAFGAIVSPLSLGLYSTYFVGPLGLPTGMLGLVSTLFHGAPGYDLSIWLGLVSAGVVSGVGHAYVELVNGVIWAALYGLLGCALDWLRLRVAANAANSLHRCV